VVEGNNDFADDADAAVTLKVVGDFRGTRHVVRAVYVPPRAGHRGVGPGRAEGRRLD
jgi:hypothetical protein